MLIQQQIRHWLKDRVRSLLETEEFFSHLYDIAEVIAAKNFLRSGMPPQCSFQIDQVVILWDKIMME